MQTENWRRRFWHGSGEIGYCDVGNICGNAAWGWCHACGGHFEEGFEEGEVTGQCWGWEKKDAGGHDNDSARESFAVVWVKEMNTKEGGRNERYV